MQKRSEAHCRNLRESANYFTIIDEIEESIHWIQTISATASIETLGKSLDETNLLRRKHAQLEQEIMEHEIMVSRALEEGKKLLDTKNFAHTQLAAKFKELELNWTILNQKCTTRSARLDAFCLEHKHLAQVDEWMDWLAQKQSDLMNMDYGRDQLTASKSLTKIQSMVFF